MIYSSLLNCRYTLKSMPVLSIAANLSNFLQLIVKSNKPQHYNKFRKLLLENCLLINIILICMMPVPEKFKKPLWRWKDIAMFHHSPPPPKKI